MPKGVYPRLSKATKKRRRFYRRGRAVTFRPDAQLIKQVERPAPRTLWDVIETWSPARLKAVLERIPLD